MEILKFYHFLTMHLKDIYWVPTYLDAIGSSVLFCYEKHCDE